MSVPIPPQPVDRSLKPLPSRIVTAETPKFRDLASVMSLSLDAKAAGLRQLHDLLPKPARSPEALAAIQYGTEEALVIMQGHDCPAGRVRRLHTRATETLSLGPGRPPQLIERDLRVALSEAADELLFAIGQLAVEAHYEIGGGYGSTPSNAAA